MKKHILLTILILSLTNGVLAATPVWTFTPLSPTTISIDPFQIKNIDYLITNQSSISHTIAIQPYPFEITNLGPFSCGEVFTLLPNKSCILSVLIKGFAVTDSFKGGPILCEVGSKFLCYTPDADDVLTVIFNNN